MSHYKPYSAYKDSGVEWIGQVPEHWEIKRLKFTVAASKNGVWGEDPAGNLIDDMPCVRVADFDRENLRAILDQPTMRKVSESERKGRVLAFGDLLLEKSGGGENQPVGCVVRYEDTVPAVCSNFVARLVVSDNCDSEFVKFLNFALYSTRISTNSINQTSGIQNLDQDRYFNEIVTLPDKEEQAFIALKIRAETTRIDTLIAKKTRFIELLKEKRQALITHAVTKGLDPNVKMKDSGVEWIGEVPEHWEVNRLKFTVASSKNGVWGEDPTGDDIEDLPCVRVADFNRDQLTVDLKEPTMRKIAVNERRGRILKYGDLLLEKSGGGEKQPVGCVVQYEGQAPAVCSNFIARIEVAKECDPTFVKYVHFALYCTRISTNSINQTSGIQNLDQDRYFNEVIALPPYTEQSNIAATIDGRTSRIDTLMVKSKLSIYLLKERRSALITAAVTGQIDLR